MFKELIERYQSSSESELINIYNNKEGYTDEAKKALQIVIEKKGGLRVLQERHQNLIEIEEEKGQLKKEILKLKAEKLNNDEIRLKIKPNKLSEGDITELLNQTFQEFEGQERDLEIKPKTIIGSLTGGIIGGTIGGILWGLQMIYSAHIFFIFGFGLFVISYGMIKLLTKQSISNGAVLVSVFLSVIYALVLGFFLYNLIGYRGPNRI